MEYARVIDSVAFDQDDLYDLLDEGVEEIYLCGNRFSIPVSKTNVKYVGIIDNVVVVITSKQIVDFESKSIVFVNCRFDEKYAQLLNEKGVNTEINKVDEENIIEDMDNSEDELNIDKDEISDFVSNIVETLLDFAHKEFENEDDCLYEYYNYIQCDARAYNDNGFETKAKAKAACKLALTDAISDVKESYESEKKELIDDTEIYFESMKYSVAEFLDTVFFESYVTFLDIYCTDDTKKYLEDKLLVLKSIINSAIGGWKETILKKCKEAFNRVIKDHFDVAESKVTSTRELFNMCEYEEMYDEYEFTMYDACSTLKDDFDSIIKTEKEDFPKSIYNVYNEINNGYINWLEKKF